MDHAPDHRWVLGLAALVGAAQAVSAKVTWVNPVPRGRWKGSVPARLTAMVPMLDASPEERDLIWDSLAGGAVRTPEATPWTRDARLDAAAAAFLDGIDTSAPDLRRGVGTIRRLLTDGGAEALRMAMYAAVPHQLSVESAHRLRLMLTDEAHPMSTSSVAQLLHSPMVENASGSAMRLIQPARDILLAMLAQIEPAAGRRVAHALLADLATHPLDDPDETPAQIWSANVHLDPTTVAREIAGLIARQHFQTRTERADYVGYLAHVVRTLRVPFIGEPTLVRYCDLIGSAERGTLDAEQTQPVTVAGIHLPSPKAVVGRSGTYL